MVEDKVLVSLVLLVVVGLLVAFRTARYGWLLGRPNWAGVGIVPALFVWLGAPLTHPLSWVASIVAALSVPLLVYGADGVRAAFTPLRKVV
jgi:hypothetical protein